MPDIKAADKVDLHCPTCGVLVTGASCRLCGATKSINQVSGNVIWMRNGRIVAAFADARSAWVAMAERYNIPKDQWPVEYRR